MSCYHCYLDDYTSIASPTPSNVWFATWDYGGKVDWSQSPPATAPDGVTTFAVAVSFETTARTGVTPMATTKDQPPPQQSFHANNIDDFKTQFVVWANSIRGHEIPASA